MKQRKVLVLFATSITIAFGVYYYFNFNYCRTHVPARSEFGKLPVLDPEKVDGSYTLLSPFTAGNNLTDEGNVYLVDLFGFPVHIWNTKYQTLYAQLQKNGSIIVSMITPSDLNSAPGGGKTGLIQELNWNGEVLWEYRNDFIHHDFEILPNGNVALLVWERAPGSFAEKVQGGRLEEGKNLDEVWVDGIIEVDRDGQVVWGWHAYDHLRPEAYVLSPYTPRSEWTHANSVRYFERNALNGQAGYLLSLRHLNEVIMISRESGDVFWESPKGAFTYQHDATILPNGNILGFDNGLFRSQDRPLLWSRVIEIDPLSNKIIWEFNGGKTGPEKARFAASIMSGAQRLSNGNTLIVDGPKGHLIEVRPDGRRVWDFINPHTSINTGSFENNSIFKARRYLPEEIEWPENISAPLPQGALFCRV